MPNGGSDCCGTCPFNAKNKGEAGYAHRRDPEPEFCNIRSLAIENAMYTYCANHPHRNPAKLTVPIGPVFRGNDLGQREIWVTSPDSEEIRLALLELLAGISAEPVSEYPLGIPLETVIIWQLAEFGEKRAIRDLARLAAFDPNRTDEFGRTREGTVRQAKDALAKLQA